MPSWSGLRGKILNIDKESIDFELEVKNNIYNYIKELMKNKTFNTPEGKREFIDSIFERIKSIEIMLYT